MLSYPILFALHYTYVHLQYKLSRQYAYRDAEHAATRIRSVGSRVAEAAAEEATSASAGQ